MGQVLGRLARSRRVQLTPIPQADAKQFAAAEQYVVHGWSNAGVTVPRDRAGKEVV